MSDTRYLRPFAEVRGMGQADVTLALVDGSGRVKFVDKTRHVLRSRSVRVIADTWLPLEKIEHAGKWSLAVYINERLVGVHPFRWMQVNHNTDMLQRLHNDGELSDDLRRAVHHDNFRPMSLDELLADQED
jgi:hypothetical protein